MRPIRTPGIGRVKAEIERLNRRSETEYELSVPAHVMSTVEQRVYALTHLRLIKTEILRIQTPVGIKFSESDMRRLMMLLRASHVWGVNAGEFQASATAWRLFADELSSTTIGFVWVNEFGKDIGASRDMHAWLLGIAQFRNRGVLRGRCSPLAENRRKMPSWSARAVQPWYDGENRATHGPLARKFLFNPQSSQFYRIGKRGPEGGFKPREPKKI